MKMNEYTPRPILNNESIQFSKNQLDNLDQGMTTATLESSFGEPNLPDNFVITPYPPSQLQEYEHRSFGLPQYRSTDEIKNDTTESIDEKSKEEYLNSINPKPNDFTLEEETVQNRPNTIYDWNAGKGENTKISSVYSNSTLSMANV
jgi:hypothetical protein